MRGSLPHIIATPWPLPQLVKHEGSRVSRSIHTNPLVNQSIQWQHHPLQLTTSQPASQSASGLTGFPACRSTSQYKIPPDIPRVREHMQYVAIVRARLGGFHSPAAHNDSEGLGLAEKHRILPLLLIRLLAHPSPPLTAQSRPSPPIPAYPRPSLSIHAHSLSRA